MQFHVIMFILDHMNEEKLLNIMDESFLSELVWDDNGTTMDISNNNNKANLQQKVSKADTKAPLQATPKPNDPTMNRLVQNDVKPTLKKIIPAPTTQQYQHIKPAPPQHSKNHQKSTPMILTQHRSNIKNTSPSTIVLGPNSNYYNLKTIAPATQQHQQQINAMNLKGNKSQIIQQATPITSAQALPVMQQVLTFQTTDKQQLVLAPSTVYTSATNDPMSRPRTLAVTTTRRLPSSRLIWFGPGAMSSDATSPSCT